MYLMQCIEHLRMHYTITNIISSMLFVKMGCYSGNIYFKVALFNVSIISFGRAFFCCYIHPMVCVVDTGDFEIVNEVEVVFYFYFLLHVVVCVLLKNTAVHERHIQYRTLCNVYLYTKM